MQDHLKNALQESADLLTSVIQDDEVMATMATLAQVLADAFSKGQKVLIAGNGGSACDAMHFAEELTGRFRKDRPALPALALTDPGHITCVGNDYGFEHIFSRGVAAHGQPGDIFIGLSTSGNSANVVAAVAEAQSKGLVTVTFLGQSGGRLKGHAQHECLIPGRSADRIQEVHMALLHSLIEAVERLLYPSLY